MSPSPYKSKEDEAPSERPATALAPVSPTPSAWLQRMLLSVDACGEFEDASGKVYRFGRGQPKFHVKFHRDDILRRPQDEVSLGHAYVRGDFDIEGDLLALFDVRSQLVDGFRLKPWLQFVTHLFFRAPVRVNHKSIHDHYTHGDDFYLTFIDKRYRFYSHCLFHSDDETLEQAAEHKLECMFDALDLKPGMRLLDIGAGWGGAIEYCSPRGIHVTSLTLVQDSYNYVSALLREKQLDGKVIVQDFLTYQPAEPYDAIVIYGVIEHIPYYRQFFERAWQCLKPGGKLYIDASATKEKYSMSQFTRYYTWHGTHTFMCLQDVIQEALFAGFQFVEAKEETHDYELTMLHWARRLDENRSRIVARWGEELYRAFRIFLWGGCHAFKTDRLQAYHLVVRRSPDPGPRPRRLQRFSSFLREIA